MEKSHFRPSLLHHVRLMTIGCYVVVVARLYDFSWYSHSFFSHFLYFGVFRFSLWIFHVFLFFFDGNDDDDGDDDGTHHKSTILLKNKRWFYIKYVRMYVFFPYLLFAIALLYILFLCFISAIADFLLFSSLASFLCGQFSPQLSAIVCVCVHTYMCIFVCMYTFPPLNMLRRVAKKKTTRKQRQNK